VGHAVRSATGSRHSWDRLAKTNTRRDDGSKRKCLNFFLRQPLVGQKHHFQARPKHGSDTFHEIGKGMKTELQQQESTKSDAARSAAAERRVADRNGARSESGVHEHRLSHTALGSTAGNERFLYGRTRVTAAGDFSIRMQGLQAREEGGDASTRHSRSGWEDRSGKS